MSSKLDKERCARTDLVSEYALRGLPSSEMAAVAAHIGDCADCSEALESIRQIVDSFAYWQTDVLRPSTSLWEGVARRIGVDSGELPASSLTDGSSEPEWEEPAPGVSCKLLAVDEEQERLTMLVRLAPGGEYPPHRHGGVEELHLLNGVLWIDDRKLEPGDYSRSEPGTSDRRVWSETGCTCVLITSSADVLG